MKPAVPLETELQPLLTSIVVGPGEALTFAGQPAPSLPPGLLESYARSRPDAPPLFHWLRFLIYTQGYTRRFDGSPQDDLRHLNVDHAFLRCLAATNPTPPRWETGWRVARPEANGAVVAEREGVRGRFMPGQYRPDDGQSLPLQPGHGLTVLHPSESSTMQPGAYFAFGETTEENVQESELLRFYWSLRAEGAVVLLPCVSRLFNRHRVPFRMKLQAQPRAYDRLDAAVLYVRRRSFWWAALLLVEVLPAVRNFLRAETPLFTKPLAPGLSLAEDPGGSRVSFGESRSMLVAEAILNAYQRGEQSFEARWRELQRLFERDGLSLTRPYLNPRSADIYELPDSTN